jgi:hypothetical protein
VIASILSGHGDRHSQLFLDYRGPTVCRLPICAPGLWKLQRSWFVDGSYQSAKACTDPAPCSDPIFWRCAARCLVLADQRWRRIHHTGVAEATAASRKHTQCNCPEACTPLIVLWSGVQFGWNGGFPRKLKETPSQSSKYPAIGWTSSLAADWEGAGVLSTGGGERRNPNGVLPSR